MLIGLLDGWARRRKPDLLVATHSPGPDAWLLPDNIFFLSSAAAATKQSSAFSNIEVILSIMAKVSLVTANESEVHSTLYPAVCPLARQPACPLVQPRERQSQKQLAREESGRFLSDSLW